jgi:hypothetical protein
MPASLRFPVSNDIFKFEGLILKFSFQLKDSVLKVRRSQEHTRISKVSTFLERLEIREKSGNFGNGRNIIVRKK